MAEPPTQTPISQNEAASFINTGRKDYGVIAMMFLRSVGGTASVKTLFVHARTRAAQRTDLIEYGSSSPGPPSPGVPPKILRPSGKVTLLASAILEPSFAG
jgi:hypothetical protein